MLWLLLIMPWTVLTQAINPKSSAPPRPGLNGVHLLTYSDGHRTIFKPGNEERGTPGNPYRNLLSQPRSTKYTGMHIGKLYLNEVAAYIFDQTTDIRAGVPLTTIATHFGVQGSEQEYIPNTRTLLSYYNLFQGYDKLFSHVKLEQLQAIAILDICLDNTDRHSLNILVTPNPHHLVPIDHGSSLRDVFYTMSSPNICYMNAKFLKQPLSSELLRKVRDIDVRAVMISILEIGIRPKSILTLFWRTELLKYQLGQRMNLFDAIHQQRTVRLSQHFGKWLESVYEQFPHFEENVVESQSFYTKFKNLLSFTIINNLHDILS